MKNNQENHTLNLANFDERRNIEQQFEDKKYGEDSIIKESDEGNSRKTRYGQDHEEATESEHSQNF